MKKVASPRELDLLFADRLRLSADRIEIYACPLHGWDVTYVDDRPGAEATNDRVKLVARASGAVYVLKPDGHD